MGQVEWVGLAEGGSRTKYKVPYLIPILAQWQLNFFYQFHIIYQTMPFHSQQVVNIEMLRVNNIFYACFILILYLNMTLTSQKKISNM